MSIQAPARDPGHGTFIEEARRRQILEAAVEVIADLGYRQASFAAIAERAGISPSLISYHFHSKAALNRAIALALAADLDGSVAGAAAQATSHLDAVRRVIIGFVDYVDRNRQRMQTLRQLELALSPDERADIGVLNEQDGIARWQDLLESGQQAGEFRPFDTRSVAAGIMGLLGAVPRELIGSPTSDAGRLGDELAQLVMSGIAAAGTTLPRTRQA